MTIIIIITNIIIIYLQHIHHVSIHLFSCLLVAELNSLELHQSWWLTSKDYSSSVYRCCVQELCTSSFISLEVFMILVSIGMAVQWRARAVLPTYRREWSMDESPRATSRDQALPAVCELPRDGSEDDVCSTAYYYSKHQETTDPTRRLPWTGSYHSVDTRSDDLSAQIYLAGWMMMSSGLPRLRSPWTS